MLVHGPHHITVNFQETAYLSIILSLFVHKISSKHDRDYNTQAEFKLKVSVKENEVPTEKYSSRASIFATKASYISN